jgi:hypothetical protein
MEIKVINKVDGATHIFDGNEVFYNFRFYENTEEYKRIIDESIKSMAWILSDYGEEIKKAGHLLYLEFVSDGNHIEMVINKSTVYITNKGQTVDKIIVD